MSTRQNAATLLRGLRAAVRQGDCRTAEKLWGKLLVSPGVRNRTVRPKTVTMAWRLRDRCHSRPR